MVFEMDVKDVQDDRFELEFHYCPLVKAWQKQGCTDEEISNLCDWAMCGDRGIGEAYGCELDLPKTIARGDDVCHLIYHAEASRQKRRCARAGNRLWTQALFFLIGRTPG